MGVARSSSNVCALSPLLLSRGSRCIAISGFCEPRLRWHSICAAALVVRPLLSSEGCAKMVSLRVDFGGRVTIVFFLVYHGAMRERHGFAVGAYSSGLSIGTCLPKQAGLIVYLYSPSSSLNAQSHTRRCIGSLAGIAIELKVSLPSIS